MGSKGSMVPYLVLGFALFYYMFELTILCEIAPWITMTESFLQKDRISRCWSNMYVSQIVQNRINNLLVANCDRSNPYPHSIPEIKASEFAGRAEVCEEMKKVSGDWWKPFVVRGFSDTRWNPEEDPSFIGMRDIDALLWIRNKTASEAEIHTVGDCPEYRQKHVFKATFNDFYKWTKYQPDNRYYIAFNEEIYNSNPKLQEYIGHNDFCGVDILKSEIFVQHKGTYVENEPPSSYMHSAPTPNAFLQVTGNKHWTIMDPRLEGAIGGFFSGPESAIYISAFYGFYLADKKLQECRPSYSIDTEPGDLLYLPAWWFHEVSNTNAGWNVGTSLRALWDLGSQVVYNKPNMPFAKALIESVGKYYWSAVDTKSLAGTKAEAIQHPKIFMDALGLTAEQLFPTLPEEARDLE